MLPQLLKYIYNYNPEKWALQSAQLNAHWPPPTCNRVPAGKFQTESRYKKYESTLEVPKKLHELSYSNTKSHAITIKEVTN